jgi:hypothetical protein
VTVTHRTKTERQAAKNSPWHSEVSGTGCNGLPSRDCNAVCAVALVFLPFVDCARQLLKERQHVATLQLPANNHQTVSIHAVNLKNRLGDVETSRTVCIVSSSESWEPSTAPTSLTLSCRWRSRPQHHERTQKCRRRLISGTKETDRATSFGRGGSQRNKQRDVGAKRRGWQRQFTTQLF